MVDRRFCSLLTLNLILIPALQYLSDTFPEMRLVVPLMTVHGRENSTLTLKTTDPPKPLENDVKNDKEAVFNNLDTIGKKREIWKLLEPNAKALETSKARSGFST